MSNKAKVIFHVDMNSFYASVEMAYNPSLKGKAIAIAGNPEERKGIIVTSSYEARAMGVKTTMPIWEAKKHCPQLIIIRPNFERYRSMSAKIFKLLLEITPLVEPISIDEGYLDVTNHPENPLLLAKKIQTNILKRLDIPCSIGIGPNKFLAKTASDMKKPLGITVLRKRDLPFKLWPLPIDKMYGVGEKTANKLKTMNIYTIGDLAKTDTYTLAHLLGINGERLKNRANGIDPSLVDPEAVNDFKSIGNSQTLPYDTENKQEIKQLLLQLSKRVSGRLKRRELKGQTVQLMIRYAKHKTITRIKKLNTYIYEQEEILLHIYELLDENWNKQPVRLLGITVQDIMESKEIKHQLSLFTYEEEEKKLKVQQTVEQLTKKYGENVFKHMNDTEQTDDDKMLRTSFQKDFLDDYKNK